MTLPIAILAGGLATRLRPMTETIPKALVQVAGEPFAFHQLRLLARKGLRQVVYCIGYRGEQVAQAVGDGSRFGLRVRYSSDGPTLLGTGGAVCRALPLLGNRFFVLYGDAYLDCEYGEIEAAFERSNAPALMTVFRNEGQWDASNVEFEHGRIVAYSKMHPTPRMHHIDYGLGAFEARIFAGLPQDVVTDVAAIYEQLATEHRLAAYECRQRFYEVGSLAGIHELEKRLTGTCGR